MQARNWIKLERDRPRPNAQQMKFTLNKSAVLWFNRVAFTALRQPAAVEIFYDEANGLIGLIAADMDAPHACPVRPHTGASGKWVTLRRFCTKFNLSIDRTIYFRTPTFDPDGTLVLNYRQALAFGRPTSESAPTPPPE